MIKALCVEKYKISIILLASMFIIMIPNLAFQIYLAIR